MKKRIMAMALVLLLTACRQETSVQTQQPSADTALLTSQYVYTASYVPLQASGLLINGVMDACFSGETLYFTANRGTGERAAEDGSTYPGEFSLLRLDEASQEPVLLADHTSRPLPDGAVTGALDIVAMTPGADGTVWVWQQLFTCDENGSGTTHTPQLCQYDADGDLLQSVEVQGAAPMYVERMLQDEAGCFAVSDGESIWLLDGQGKLLHMLKPNERLELSRYDGVCGCLLENETGQSVFRPLDFQTAEFGTEVTLEEGAAHIHPGNGTYSYLYDRGGDAVYGCRTEDGSSERLLTWSDYGILNYDILRYAIGETGDIRCVTVGGEAVYLKRTDPSLLPEQTVLTMGCLNGMASFIQKDVITFNRTHPSVKISIIDYAEFDESAGETLLHTQLLAGEGPDLFYMDSMNLMQLADTGTLLDLWPLIDADGELTRDNLMTHVFDVMSREEKLYGVSSSFLIETNAVLAEHLPEQTGWTLQELKEAREQAGNCPYIFGAGDSRAGLLFRMVGHNSGDYLDWESGECRFDTPEFVELLEFVKEFPEEAESLPYDQEAERIFQKEQLCADQYINSFAAFKYALETFGNDVRFVSYPSETGHNYFRLSGSFGIAAGCENVDAAWEFGRMLLTETYQREASFSFGFPTNRAVFEQELTRAMSVGKSVWDQYWLTDGDSHQTAPLTQADRDRFMALYESCDRTIGYNDAVMTIVFEETEYFFNDIKSAKETAAMIQDRVSLYMAERKVTS